jgi:predicted phage tail protein
MPGAGGGGGGAGATNAVPFSKQSVVITDLICEGPIRGLVGAESGVYLNDAMSVPPEESGLYSIDGTMTVSTTNGSTSVTINNAPAGLTREIAEDIEADAITPTTAKRWLTVQNFTGPIAVTVLGSEVSGRARVGDRSMRQLAVVGGANSLTAAMMSDRSALGSDLATYVPAHIIPDSDSLYDIGREPIAGFLSYTASSGSGSVNKCLFQPGSNLRNSGFTIRNGSYKLFVDKIAEITAIDGNTLTLKNAWSGNPTSSATPYSFNLSGTFYNGNITQLNNYLNNYPGVQTQFRTGREVQHPFSGEAGPGTVGVSNVPSAGGSIEQSNDFGGSEAPKTLVGSSDTGFNLTASQIRNVSEVRIFFKYPALYKIDDEGKESENLAQYKVTLALQEDGSSSFSPAFVLHDNLTHGGQFKSSVSWAVTVDMERYGPIADFKFVISRKTPHDGDAVNRKGDVIEETTNISSTSISQTVAILKQNLSHPYAAMAKVGFNSKQFNSTPKRSYHLQGLMVRVPSNYVTREESLTGHATYNRDSNGVVQSTYQDWDGSFRDTLVYTNNPAWIFFDIMVNNRYGLGDFLSSSDIDIYQLYKIARYCDELVDDGSGNDTKEPRFTSNIFLTKKTDSFKILKDMLSTFRSILYFIDGQVTAVQDAPSGPIYNFSKANVIDGTFEYEGTGGKTRVNQVVVTWNNPDINYKPEPLLIEDRDNILETGKIISQDAVAFGCTSFGQALRYGRWKLWTAANQTEIVKFATGLNGSFLKPGDIVNVQDADKSGFRHGGRISGNLEAGLSVSASYAAGGIATSASGFTNAHRAQNVVMAGEVILPTTFSEDQCLMEYGGTGTGMYVGIRDIGGVDNFVFRAGNGTATETSTACVLGEIPVSQIPEFDGRAHTVAWEMQPAAGQARLWIDGKNYFDLVTTDGSAMQGSTWSGSNLGGWGIGQSASAGSYALTAWSGSIISALRVYTNQIVPLSKTTIPLDSPVALLATSSYDLSVMFIDEAATLAQDSATIDSVNYVRGDLIPQAFIDSNGDGTYTLQDISTKAFSTNAKAAASSTDALLLDFSENHRVETRTVSTSAGTDISQLSVGTAFSSLPSKSHIWVLKETANSGAVTDAAALPYKILSIVEEDDSSYGLIGVRHYDEKFSAIEGVFTTYVEDTIAPRLLPTDTVPTVQSVTVTELPNPSISGNEFILEWEAPASQGTLSDIEESNIDQSALEGGALTTYEHLEEYEITHNIEEIESPILVPKTDTYYKFEGIENGFYTFGVKAVSVIGSKSRVKQTVAEFEDVYGQNVKRVALGMATGGTSDTSMFTDEAGLFQFEKSSYKVKSDGNGRLQENTSTTATAWSQDCSDMPAISYTPSTSNIFESDLFYIMLDYSDATDKVKLVKLHREAYGEDYWYDAGTGNATNRFSAQKTGSISKAANSNLIKGSGTAFTTEFKIGDILAAGTGDSPTVLGRITHIRDNTTLYLNKDGNYTVTSSHIRASNLDVDFINDVVVGSIYKTGSSFIFNAYTSLATATPTLVESDDSTLAYYWPSNSVNGDYITETVAAVHGEAIGTAPTVSTQSPAGNSLVNDDGMLLLSDSQADALESGGFSASYWFKSTSSSGSGNARLLTRDNNNHWAMYMGQNEAADGVQNLKLQATGTGATVVKTNAITLNQWHHAGIVYDGTNFKFFLDGEEIFNKTGYTPLTDNARPIVFGVNTEASPQTQNKFVGQFTEIKFFDDPISNAQMRNLYRLPGSTVAGTSDMPIQLGGENGSVLKVTSDGLSLGNTTFASAPFRVDMAGNLTATSGTFSGSITGATGTFAGELTAGSLTVDKLSGDFNEEYATQFRSVQTGDHTLASTLGTYSTIQEFSIPAPEGVAKAVKVSGTLSTKAFNGTGSTQSTEYSIHLEMKAKGTAATNLGTAAADAVSAGLSAETVYISGNKLKEFGSAGSVSAAADGSSGQGDVIGVYYDAPNNRTYIEYLDASLSFDSGDTVHYSAENFTSASGFVQIQSGFDDATDRHSVIALPNNETFYDKTYLSASLPKTSTATEFRLRVRNRKVLPTNLNVTFPTGAFKLEHTV